MDREMLCELYRRYKKELYLYIYSLCRNKDVAEDILQETFLKALLSLPDNHGNIRAWFYKVARNLYFNYAKKEKHRADIEEAEVIICEDVADKVIATEKKKLLYQALQKLSRIKREVLVLQYFAGLQQKEIGLVLSLTPENVRVLSFRGRKEIEKYMEANGYDI